MIFRELKKMFRQNGRFLVFSAGIVGAASIFLSLPLYGPLVTLAPAWSRAEWHAAEARAVASDKQSIALLDEALAHDSSQAVAIRHDLANDQRQLTLDEGALQSGRAALWHHPGAFALLGSFLPVGGVLVLLLAVKLGSELVAGERAGGTLSLVLSGPVRRQRLYRARVGAVGLVTIALFIGGVAIALAVSGLVLPGSVFDEVWVPLSNSGADPAHTGIVLSVAVIVGVAILLWTGGALLFMGLGVLLSTASSRPATVATVVSVAVIASVLIGVPLIQSVGEAWGTALMVFQPTVGLAGSAMHWQKGIGLVPSLVAGGAAAALGGILFAIGQVRFATHDVK